jgi:hypothetical protein
VEEWILGTLIECLEYGEHDQHSRPTVVKRKKKMHEEFIRKARRRVGFLDDVVDVLSSVPSGPSLTRYYSPRAQTHRNENADEERKNECYISRVS